MVNNTKNKKFTFNIKVLEVPELNKGYHYPDLFGERTNTKLALRKHAKKVNLHMKKMV